MKSHTALALALCVCLAALANAQQNHDTIPRDALSNGGTTAAGAISNRATEQSHKAPPRVIRMYTAHAILACLAWAAIFPIGGIMIRVLSFSGLLWVHAGLQIFGYCLYIAAVGLGIELSINPKFWRMGNKHVIIGLTIFVLFAMQGCTGYIHHLVFKRIMSRSTWSHIHLWTGRLCVTLGMINAGFGFQITHKGVNTWEVKTYTVFAVLVWVTYVVAIVIGEMRKRKAIAARKEELANSSDGNSQAGVALRNMAAKLDPENSAHTFEKEFSA